jgi:hypothetical protein
MAKLKGHLIAALILCGLDALVAGQGVVSLLIGLFAAAVLFPLWLRAQLDRDREAAARRAGLAAIYGLCALAAVCWVALNNRMADRRAHAVVKACLDFKAKRGAWPERLEELAPEFLPSVPRAKYTAAYGRFQYHASPERHRLLWTVFPPFGRRWVLLEEGRTGIVD